MKRKTLLILMATLALALTACGSATAPDQPATNPPPAADQPATLPDIVARVNGEPITREAYQRLYNRVAQYSLIADERALADSVLETLIEQSVINQAAAELGVVVADGEAQAELDRLIASAGSPDAWQAWLRDNQFTEAELLAATRDQLITARLRERVLAADLPSASPQTVQRVRARHILVQTPDEANAILQRLRNGESFSELARAFSRDVTTRDSGGDLGFFSRDDLTTPELADVAFSLAIDELAGPIQTVLGYHVIQTLEFSTATLSPDSDSAEAEFQFLEWLLERRRAAVVERFIE